tara:strand:- start:38 stop:328 length:291 start_codon:yes stop_codon:yes gene_type:complete
MAKNTHICDDFANVPVFDFHFCANEKKENTMHLDPVPPIALNKHCCQENKLPQKHSPTKLIVITNKKRTADKVLRLSKRGAKTLKKIWRHARHAFD